MNQEDSSRGLHGLTCALTSCNVTPYLPPLCFMVGSEASRGCHMSLSLMIGSIGNRSLGGLRKRIELRDHYFQVEIAKGEQLLWRQDDAWHSHSTILFL